MKGEEGRGDQKPSCDGVIPAQVGTEIVGGEYAEDRERNDFLNYFELHRSEAAVADAVCRHLEAILEEGDSPTDQNDLPQRFVAESEVPVPGKGHENVGNGEKNDGPHFEIVSTANARN